MKWLQQIVLSDKKQAETIKLYNGNVLCYEDFIFIFNTFIFIQLSEC